MQTTLHFCLGTRDRGFEAAWLLAEVEVEDNDEKEGAAAGAAGAAAVGAIGAAVESGGAEE